MRWIQVTTPPAVCVSAAGARRPSAARLLVGSLPPPAQLAAIAPGPEAEPPIAGRVTSGGSFELPAAHAALAEALGAALGTRLRRRFEWYLCRGAFFHNDAHFADVLFGAWCVAGPPREIVFPRLRLRTTAAPGHWTVFDPFEPHAVLDPGASTYDRACYAHARASVFVGFEIELDETTRAAFAIEKPVHAPELSSRTRINAETGTIG
jgi:hypothetical protein